MTFIYLASPYIDPSSAVIYNRYIRTMYVCAEILKAGITVYSPIVHCHVMSSTCDLPKGFEFFREHDFNMIRSCTEIWVLKLPGFEESKGVEAEMLFARNIGKPVVLIPEDWAEKWQK